MSVENTALVRRWFDEVWNQGRAAAIDEMLASQAVAHGLGVSEAGPAGFKTFHAAFRNAFPDITIQIDDMTAEGDVVAARWSATGTHRGNGLGFDATHRPVQFGGMTFVRIRNGQLIEGWNHFDQLGMFQQLGVVSLPTAG